MAVDLMNYLQPPELQEIREFRAIIESEEIEAESLRRSCLATRDELYVSTMSEYGVSIIEKMLKIIPKDTDTLEDRRFVLFARHNEQSPFTFKSIENQIERLCGVGGYSFEYGPEPFHLKVRVVLKAKNQLNEVGLTLRKTVPANVVVDLSLLYNQWLTLATKKWGDMTAITWYNARNEVI